MREYIEGVTINVKRAALNHEGVLYFHDGRMFVGGMISPNRDTQIEVLYKTIAEEIKKQQLEMGIDVFVNPELHTNSSGEKMADILAK